MAEIQPEVTLETACSLLEDEYRRGVLRILGPWSGAMARRELARELAREVGRAEAVERVDRSLYHLHLPKLADENSIRYDTDSETVAITERGTRLLRCLDDLERGLADR